MFIKALVFFALIMIVVTLVKRGKKGGSSLPTTIDTSSENNMKRCAECGVHLPEQEALTYQTLSFCCNDHKKLYLKDKKV
ncbi:hypothetical protein A9Q81_25960 [Gammaproteobacteria bacterium 42_54_T18]|nr:hypothetical protein A9Q81_25960 [Gammaproteobacteria bacterium 42_54_T18]